MLRKILLFVLVVGLISIFFVFLFIRNSDPQSCSGDGCEQVYCAMDAQLCPDGSFVGRVPPECEFSPCPSVKEKLENCMFQSDIESRNKCNFIISNINSFEQCIDAGFSTLKSVPEQCSTPDGRIFKNENNQDWENLKNAILRCEVKELFQDHEQNVTATLKDGKKMIAIEPNIDDVFKIAKRVENKCDKMILSTE
jgi:hypothetical protein